MIARITAVLALALVAGLGATGPGNASDLAIARQHPGPRHAPPAIACPPGDPDAIVAPVPIELLIGPGIDYQTIAVVPACRPLRIILCDYRAGWCRVSYGRHDGWLFDPPRRDILHYVLGH